MAKSVSWDIIVIVFCAVAAVIMVCVGLRKLQLRRRALAEPTEFQDASSRTKQQIEAESRARNFRHRAQSISKKVPLPPDAVKDAETRGAALVTVNEASSSKSVRVIKNISVTAERNADIESGIVARTSPGSFDGGSNIMTL